MDAVRDTATMTATSDIQCRPRREPRERPAALRLAQRLPASTRGGTRRDPTPRCSLTPMPGAVPGRPCAGFPLAVPRGLASSPTQRLQPPALGHTHMIRSAKCKEFITNSCCDQFHNIGHM